MCATPRSAQRVSSFDQLPVGRVNAVHVLVDDRLPEVAVADDRSANAVVKIAPDDEVAHLFIADN